jgi:hypothetical protein
MGMAGLFYATHQALDVEAWWKKVLIFMSLFEELPPLKRNVLLFWQNVPINRELIMWDFIP